MRPCEEYAALLDAYVDGELIPEEMAQVRDHLETCPGCQAYVDDALAIRASFPDVEETQVPDGFAESVSAAIRAGAAPQRRRRPRWIRTAAPLAACCALAVLFSQLPGLLGGNSAVVRSEDTAAEAEVRESIPEERSVDDTGADAGAAAPHTYAAQREEGEAAVTAEGAEDVPENFLADAAPEDGAAPAEALPESSAAEEGAAGDGAAASGDTVPKSGGQPMVNAALVSGEPEDGNWFATLTLTMDQAGSALEDLPPETPVSSDPDTGGTVYWLTAEQFTGLLEALGDPPYTAEGDGDLARVILLPE